MVTLLNCLGIIKCVNMTGKRGFSSLKLIKKVREFPILYNPHVAPKIRGKRYYQASEAWSKVSEALGVSKTVCRKKWFRLRGYYATCIKNGIIGINGIHLRFLKPFMNAKTKMISNRRYVRARNKAKKEEEIRFYMRKCSVLWNQMSPNMKLQVKLRIAALKNLNLKFKKYVGSMPKWTDSMKKKFISTVSEFPVVYDNSGSEKDEDAAWEEIAKINKTSTTICRRKWRWLRTAFSKSMRDGTRKYRYYDDLQFLEEFVDGQPILPIIYSEESSEDSSIEDFDS